MVSGLLKPDGAPGLLLAAWEEGRFDLAISPGWLEELHVVLARPWLQERISSRSVAELLQAVADHALPFDDPTVVARFTPDPGDDYLVALARAAGADALVSGDAHLTGLARPEPPVLTPRQLAALLAVSP